jgi:hypothetical protein
MIAHLHLLLFLYFTQIIFCANIIIAGELHC